MLSGVSTAKRRLSQAPLKATVCYGGCGVVVQFRTNPKICCPSCQRERKNASARIAMEKQRRKRGVPEIKGSTIECVRCGTLVIRIRSARAKHCATCAADVYYERARRNSRNKRQTAEGRAYFNAWHRSRTKSDPSWRVSSHMRNLIHRGIGKKKQGRSWRKFVPYSLDELMRHLERQFTEGMCWEKVGPKIHIDHIIPLSKFSFTSPDDPEFKAAWAITNLRPMWALENIRKSGRRTHLL